MIHVDTETPRGRPEHPLVNDLVGEHNFARSSGTTTGSSGLTAVLGSTNSGTFARSTSATSNKRGASPNTITISTTANVKEFKFVHRFSRTDVNEVNIITLDHAYAKNWNAHPTAGHAKPAKYIFYSGSASDSRKIPADSSLHCRKSCLDDDSDLDVETVDVKERLPYDTNKALTLMSECERHVKLARPVDLSGDAEDNIPRQGWTQNQNKLFNRVYKTLLLARLAKLGSVGQQDEPILRRIHIDKAAKRVRQSFAAVLWDSKLLPWLHAVLMDHLPLTMLADYLDILQTLRGKVPTLIDAMMATSTYTKKMNQASSEALDLLLKRPWDPVIGTLTLFKPKKLPGNPVIVVVPMLPLGVDSQYSSPRSKRLKFWSSQLANMGNVVHITSPTLAPSADAWTAWDQMVLAVRMRLLEIAQTCRTRPVILIGWSVGALLAAYVATVERISLVVLLGFPAVGVNGLGADVDDVILNSVTPTLFVIGEHARMCPIEELEDMREKMATVNNLIIVGGANDQLNINFKKKKEEGITQSVVDRCILDEIWEFLVSHLSNFTYDESCLEDSIKKRKVKPRGNSPVDKVPRIISTALAATESGSETLMQPRRKIKAMQEKSMKKSQLRPASLPLAKAGPSSHNALTISTSQPPVVVAAKASSVPKQHLEPMTFSSGSKALESHERKKLEMIQSHGGQASSVTMDTIKEMEGCAVRPHTTEHSASLLVSSDTLMQAAGLKAQGLRSALFSHAGDSKQEIGGGKPAELSEPEPTSQIRHMLTLDGTSYVVSSPVKSVGQQSDRSVLVSSQSLVPSRLVQQLSKHSQPEGDCPVMSHLQAFTSPTQGSLSGPHKETSQSLLAPYYKAPTLSISGHTPIADSCSQQTGLGCDAPSSASSMLAVGDIPLL